MSYEITCPYCFRKMTDDQVLFRSERVERGESDILPEDYEDLEDFKARYKGSDKEKILTELREWEFFLERDDPVYEGFWKDYTATTEDNPADRELGVRAYRRPIIDPKNAKHQRYLKPQGEDYFIRDSQGMVIQIELADGDLCNRRVCPHCHNPFPDNYGKNKVKFAAIIGITGAGKTIYLSQLLSGMTNYAAKAGLSAMVSNTSARGFVEKNRVLPNFPLPGSTPTASFQQPLFYDLVRDTEGEGHVTETCVLYDVAGEVFTSQDLIQRFAPFIEHADGIIMLIDPMQLKSFNRAAVDGDILDEPTMVLQTIQNIVSHGVGTEKCKTPFAVCISKTDLPVVQDVLGRDMGYFLRSEVHGVKSGRFFAPVFNAVEYNSIARGLDDFLMKSEDFPLCQVMETNYDTYNFFAFSALNCPVEERESENGGMSFVAPVGPVLPVRIEEPLLWLFYKFGYIQPNAPVFRDTKCPICNSIYVHELPEDDRLDEVQGGLFGMFRKTVSVDHVCEECGSRWLQLEV